MDYSIREATCQCFNRTTQLIGLYPELCILKTEYPDFDHWYFGKVVPEAKLGLRKIFVVEVNQQHAGVLILKESEKKICTLRVSPQFQRMGIGNNLINIAFQELSTHLPFITVSNSHIDDFSGLFKRHCFQLKEVHINKYRPGGLEFVYNGHLN